MAIGKNSDIEVAMRQPSSPAAGRGAAEKVAEVQARATGAVFIYLLALMAHACWGSAYSIGGISRPRPRLRIHG
jgi:hypothetical protein